MLGAAALAGLAPHAGIDPRLGALVGMAAVFAGASRAMLASVVFAFETTREVNALPAILAGCAAAYLVSMLSMRHSIMTEKIARRGALVPSDWAADILQQVPVGQSCTRPAVALARSRSVAEVRSWLEQTGEAWRHQAFPVVDGATVVGVVTQRALRRPSPASTVGELVDRPPVTITESASLRDAADTMLSAGVGRLPVVDHDGALVGILTRSDLLAAFRRRSVQAGA
jgi:CBS domain-containing protein